MLTPYYLSSIKYPNEKIGRKESIYCKALHTSECKSLNVQELQAKAEEQDLEDAKAYEAACREQAPNNL